MLRQALITTWRCEERTILYIILRKIERNTTFTAEKVSGAAFVPQEGLREWENNLLLWIHGSPGRKAWEIEVGNKKRLLNIFWISGGVGCQPHQQKIAHK